ncbi:MAG TPA: DUF4124 domain-containing protein [Gammaproteobacteria bacterium]|nr:DUF4124 domain-containing protein [Gammaproteobacteria bacterium]
MKSYRNPRQPTLFQPTRQYPDASCHPHGLHQGHRKHRITILLIITITGAPSLTAADIYRWVDQQGNVSFSDKAPPNMKAEKLYLSPANAYPARPTPPPSIPDKDSATSPIAKPMPLSTTEENCGYWGLQLRTLKKQDAVYIDNKNHFRGNRENFSLGYVGSRSYLSDQQRQKETEKLEQAIKKHCGDTPEAHKRQLEAMLKIKRKERCEALKARLAQMLQPGKRTANSDIRDTRAKIETACATDQRARKSRARKLQGTLESSENHRENHITSPYQ